MSIDHEAVRAFIGGGGEYATEIVSGFSLTSGADVDGLRIKTRGRVKPLARWHKEFVLYAKDDQTIDDLYRILPIWTTGAAPSPSNNGTGEA